MNRRDFLKLIGAGIAAIVVGRTPVSLAESTAIMSGMFWAKIKPIDRRPKDKNIRCKVEALDSRGAWHDVSADVAPGDKWHIVHWATDRWTGDVLALVNERGRSECAPSRSSAT